MFDKVAYQRAYYFAHKNEIQANYIENRAEILAYQKEYHRTHKKEHRAYSKAYRATHKEERKEYQRGYRESMKEGTCKYVRERRAAIKAGTWVFWCDRKTEHTQEQTQKLTETEKLRAKQYAKDKDKIASPSTRNDTSGRRGRVAK